MKITIPNWIVNYSNKKKKKVDTDTAAYAFAGILLLIVGGVGYFIFTQLASGFVGPVELEPTQNTADSIPVTILDIMGSGWFTWFFVISFTGVIILRVFRRNRYY